MIQNINNQKVEDVIKAISWFRNIGYDAYLKGRGDGTTQIVAEIKLKNG